LKSGVWLCTLLNKVRPGTIRKINKMSIAYMQLENIQGFISGCRSLGMADRDLFDTVDLFEKKNMPQVAHSILEFGKLARSFPEHFQGPYPPQKGEVKPASSSAAVVPAPATVTAAAAAAKEELEEVAERARRDSAATTGGASLTQPRRQSLISAPAPPQRAPPPKPSVAAPPAATAAPAPTAHSVAAVNAETDKYVHFALLHTFATQGTVAASVLTHYVPSVFLVPVSFLSPG
jgi:hypothetical protein